MPADGLHIRIEELGLGAFMRPGIFAGVVFLGATRALDAGLAKVDKLAKIDTSGYLAKLADFESEYTARLHKASGDSCTLDEFRARIEADRAMFAKRDALTEHDYDDDGKINVARCPPGDTRWRLK